ncbi:MAG TPA: glycerophosphodiester phosphodiesterase [Solirubrobacteraceae bacterium]|jgi:glycerophosphoryl diester phosphodiesterase|nr:glycerophosphodiester phosphodiesterase [Solirubrobacteraceae bacterium]
MPALTHGHRRSDRPLRVGHKGAGHIEPGNTFASFRAALAHGVDMIELDVIAENVDGSGALLLAHDWDDAAQRRPRPHTLAEGLAHLAGSDYDSIDLIVDLKGTGHEERVAAALHEHGLAERVLVSTTEGSSLTLLRARHPELTLGWSLPRMHRNPLYNPVTAMPAVAVLLYVRRALPRVVANRIRRGEIDALMAHWRLVTADLAEAIGDAGGELYAWTVDDAKRIAALGRLGVTGVISNDPRLFGP